VKRREICLVRCGSPSASVTRTTAVAPARHVASLILRSLSTVTSMTCGGGVEAALSSVAPVGVARARRCLADAARDVTAPAAGAPARVRSGDDGVVLVVLVPRRLLHRRRRRCASRGVRLRGGGGQC